MIRPRIETKDLLLSITKNCETLNKQTHRKPQQTLEIKINQPRKSFVFIPPSQIERSWMICLRNLKVYYFIFNITEKILNLNFKQTLLMSFHLQS